jgi:dienelactone hydrolase
MRYLIVLITVFVFQNSFSQGFKHVQTVTFYAKDSVVITGDIYSLKNTNPTVLLCHQAGFSRGEYIRTARKLNIMGLACMAIDQRSGNEVNGVINQTAIDANRKKMNVGYTGAKQDIEAAIDYLFEMNGHQPIILVGSSYSASLALWIGSENKKVKAVAAFSPGEYLKNLDLADTIRTLSIPTFVTSSKREIGPVAQLLRYVNTKNVTQFKPELKGIHGSRALWDSTQGHEAYWNAFSSFIQANQ